ncbi:hypothetical protein EAW52_10950 [Pseudomonas sp. LTJR-52]|nr:hypothetical protein EAW52_10950 [Pseudomonas sp. LTJR-52]
MAEKDFSAVTVAVRKNKVKLLASAVLISICLFLFQVFSSGFGRFMPAIHPDWSSHASTTRAVYLGKDFDSPAVKATLEEFAYYPRLTYETSAWLAKALGISDLQGLTLVTHLSIIQACVFFALRLCTLFSERQVSATAKLFIVLSLYISANYLCLGFRNLIVTNSFISQAASLGIAQLLIYLAAVRPSAVKHCAIMIASSFVLSQTHMVGFVWCIGVLIVMSLGMPRATILKRIVLAGVGVLIFAAFLFSSEGLMETLKVAGTGGALAAWNGSISRERMVIVVPAVIYAAALIVFAQAYIQKRVTLEQAMWYGAGFICLGPLIAASAYTAITKGGNWYPVAKWVYTLIPEMLLFLALLCSRAKVASVSTWKVSILGLVICIAAQLPITRPAVDLETAILAESGVKSIPSERIYPGLVVDHPAINYFIARSILEIPYDNETWNWMRAAGKSDKYLSAKSFIGVIPAIPSDRRIKFRNDRENRSVAQRMIDQRWWPIEDRYVWAANSPAHLSFIAEQRPAKFIAEIVPNLPKGVDERTFEVYMNGIKLNDLKADRMEWGSPIEYEAAIPDEAVKDSGEVDIQFVWNKLKQDDPGLALLSVKYL